MKKFKQFLSLMLSLALVLPVSNLKAAEPLEEEPLMTIAFMSDLHNQQSTLENGNIRGSIVDVCDQLAEENPDVLILGGDITSDSYVNQSTLSSTLNKVVNETTKVTDNVLWITGNHDYNAGERDGYNSAPYYEYYMKEHVGELSDADAYYEDYNGEPNLLAYHYVIKGFDFIGLNTSHTDLEGGKQNSNYTFSTGAVNWIENKLNEIGKDKTVFLFGHFPFRDSNSLSSVSKGLISSTDEQLKSVLSQYPNLIYFYGHDHGTDSAYIHTDTAQRTTQYLANGKVKSERIEDNSVWKVEKTANGYTFKSTSTGKYLGFEGNLNTVSNPMDWAVSDKGDGFYTMTLISNNRGLHIGTGNKFSAGSASNIRFYKKTSDGFINSLTLDEGEEYVIVANECYALTNKTNGSSGEGIRMEPLEVKKTDTGITNVEESEASFISTFMGSLRYYNNSIETGPTVENSKVVQNLMVYVYEDRIELQMKNRGEKDGGSWDLKPFIIQRNQSDVNKVELQETLENYKFVLGDESSYTKDSFIVFKEAYTAAEEAYKDDTASQERVNAAIETLKESYKKLKFVNEADLSFFAISDTHIGGTYASNNPDPYGGFVDALQDMARINPDNSVILNAGDITDGASDAQYTQVYDAVEKFGTGKPIFILGNHDVRWQCSPTVNNGADEPTCPVGTSTYAQKYLKYNSKYMGDVEENQLYFDQWINGYHFIALNTEKDLKDRAYLSENQLNWLKEKLAENASEDKPIFVTIHQTFAGAGASEGDAGAVIGAQEEQLKEILKEYPQTVVLTGHVHTGAKSLRVYNKDYAHVVTVPSLYYNSVGNGRIGYQVNVYGDTVQVRLFDFENNEWLDDYSSIFKLSDVDTDSSLSIFDLPLKGLTATAGSQNSTSGSEGPASNVLDNDTNTKWHTKYGGIPIEDCWINIHLDEKQMVNGLRYLPRQDGGTNGTILKYEIWTSSDNGETYQKATEGRWVGDSQWKMANFDAKEVTDVKLVPISSLPASQYGSASEIRLTYTKSYTKEDLQAEINKYKELNEKDYSRDSWDKLVQVIGSAEKILQKENPTNTELGTAINDIEMAINQLISIDDPSVSDFDLSLDILSATSGSNANVTNEGPAEYALDNKPETRWHTQYGGTDIENCWINIHLDEARRVNGLRYLPRQDSGVNGIILQYEIWVSSDNGTTYNKVYSGEWNEDKVWKLAEFEAQEVTDVKLVPITSKPNNRYASASEIRLIDKEIIDKSALEALVKESEKLNGEEYTTSTWTAFSTVLEDAKAVLAKEDATQDEVDNAAEALSSAKEALVKRASEQLLEVLSEKVSAAEATKDMYEAEDFVDVQAAIDAAKALLANPEEAGSLDAVNALTNLAKAISELPDYKALRETLEETVKYVEEHVLTNVDGIRPGKVQELKDAVAEAKEVLANSNASAKAMKASIDKVTQKVQELWEIVNKDELNAVITSAKAISEEGYTEESYNALQEAIKAAEKVAANDDATTTEVKEAISSVAEAIANLEKEAVLDKTALEKEISLVEKMVANIDDYVAGTVKGLEDKLNQAKDVLANAATQEEIDEATAMLREARLSARVKADKEALKEAIETAGKYDLSKYTKASAQALRNALSNAEKVLKDEAATQEEVDATTKAINKAINNLTLNSNVPGEDSNTSDNTQSEDNNNTATGSDTEKAPVKTGVTSQAGAFAGMVAVAAGAAFIAMKKKKESEE